MRRIGLVLAFALTLAPLAAEGQQQAGKARRIGVLAPAEPASATEPHIRAFRQGLRDRGYVEGQNVVVSTDTLTARPSFTPNWSPSSSAST